jgi:cytochrome c biogenesis protein CcdA/thiol-disulfide isomerase/thioredoxin
VALLILIAFAAGLVTAVSPCVLPVLPILLAGGAGGATRRPYAIVAGVVASFTVFTLTAATLLDALGLPQDLLRDAAIALLLVAAAATAFPRLGGLLERPFAALTRRRTRELGGGFVLGVAVGLVFVPCAGPVLAAIAVLAASRDFGAEAFAVTGAYAAGAAVPMLAIALAGSRVARAFRPGWVRPALGALIAAAALAIALDLTRPLQTFVPGYTEALQERIERSAPADRALARITGDRAEETDELADYGPAPDVAEISEWLNTERPLSLASLRGKVVVIDFWTYSCINCLRTLPYLKAWDDAYRRDGLVILGVHTPEFSFERVPGNVRRAVRELGIRYPVALDNDYGTWHAYGNRYWPAKYFIDRRGRVRFAHFGEGEYERSEEVIRTLLAEGGAEPAGRSAQPVAARPRARITPESYLGWQRLDRYAGSRIAPDRWAEYRFPAQRLELGQLSYDGLWRVEGERILSTQNSRLRLRFLARAVHLVLEGQGEVDVRLDGRPRRSVRVTQPRLYTLVRLDGIREGVLELRFTSGLAAYAFTFGAGED